ncbi:Polycomb group protein Psc [Anthophora quadrimaculata]
MSGVGKRTYLREVNPYLICPLCRGYLIDATTVVECLHSFCRSCILKHLNTEAHCPSCKHVLNKAKPNIKADKALQDIVYKLVPGLYHKEMRKRREFYKKHPEHADLATPEQRGEDVSGRLIFAPEDAVSLSLEYLPPGADPLTILLSTNDDTSNSNLSNNQNNNSNNNSNINISTTTSNHNTNTTSNRRYLQCPALVTIAHLKKFLALKYSVDMTRYTIEICHRRAPLPEHWTLMDVAYIYAWKRNAPMRFFYRVALEEQRLEAPPHDRPSTPGLGASLPPVDVTGATEDNTNIDIHEKSVEPRPEVERTNEAEEKPAALDNQSEVSSGKARSPSDQVIRNESKEGQPSSSVATSATATSTTTSIALTTSTTTPTNTVASTASSNENKQIKTPIKILKNSDGRYEVLRSPPGSWNSKEQSITGTEGKPSNPEFSVVSIGSGQNSNGVKITLKQCTPNNASPKKPNIISNVLLHCGQMDKDSSGALMLQQIQRSREKQQAEKQEKQRRRVTFVERSTPEKIIGTNVSKALQKKPGEQQEKKQFLQGFQLTARESGPDTSLESSLKLSLEPSTGSETTDTQSKSNVTAKKEDNVVPEISSKANEAKSKGNGENIGINASGNASSASKRVATMGGIGGSTRVNSNKQCSDVDACSFGYAKSSNAVNINANSKPAKVDVYTFSNDPPVVPAGAVKRKCPPGLPIFDIKRKRQQQVHSQAAKKQAVAPPAAVVQNNTKSPRKLATEHVIPAKRPATLVGEPGPSRTPTTPTSKPSSSPVLSNDTRNILDGCGLNIPASLSITLTAPKSPGNSGGFPEPNDSKDNRKNTLGKVSPSITLNDRSVDPRVLKALKAGQIRMPAPPKPRQTKQQERDMNQQRSAAPLSKRKREQESRDILDLSGGKKVDIHPLRIPQPVTKLKTKSTVRDNVPSMSDQGQLVTLVGGHRYYRAPPGSLTPAAHRVSDCPLPAPSRAPVYAPGLSSPLNNNRSNTNLSSVFPSLQSLYALSQAPNLQQFQMDARLRLPRGTEANSTNNMPTSDSRSITTSNIPGKSHLAAQCAPVKPARSSVAPLAVPITKQQPSNDKSACINRPVANEINKTPAFRSTESPESAKQLSVQTKFLPTAENNSRFSPRNTNNGNVNTEDKPSTDVPRESNLETSNETRKEADDSSRQTPNREAASPRVSSTASPSPPPGDTNTNTNNETTSSRNDNVNTASNGIDNDVPASSPTKSNNMGAEVSSSKSPASPDSSSVTIESPSSKSCSTIEQSFPSPSQTSDALKSTEHSTKAENNAAEDSTNDNEKNATFKQPDTKQLTSEMFQKRLLAAFPSNEWANNPIAAEHLGNFLKSLNASMKSENKVESIGTEKVESEIACNNDATRLNNEATSKSRTDVAESS